MFISFLADRFRNVIDMLSGMQYLDKYIFKFHMVYVYIGDEDSFIQVICTNFELLSFYYSNMVDKSL